MVISEIRSVGDASAPRNSRSEPIASRFMSISWKVLAIVISETGYASSPFSIHKPGRAARIIAGDDIHAEADQFRDVKPASMDSIMSAGI